MNRQDLPRPRGLDPHLALVCIASARDKREAEWFPACCPHGYDETSYIILGPLEGREA